MLLHPPFTIAYYGCDAAEIFRHIHRFPVVYNWPRKSWSPWSATGFSYITYNRSYEWQTELLSHKGHGQSGWPEGLHFHATSMSKNALSVSGWSRIACEGVHTKLNIPSPLPTTLTSRDFSRLLISLIILPTSSHPRTLKKKTYPLVI